MTDFRTATDYWASLRSSWIPPIAVGLLLTVFLTFTFGTRLFARHLVLMAVGSILFSYYLGRWVSTDRDRWLPDLMALGMMAKLLGAGARYFILEVVYFGSGDAGRYHGFGLQVADQWRDFIIPDVTTVGFGSTGTRFTAWMTGLFYTPYEPSMLGGFWIFAFLAFIGQLFLYLAFRASSDPHRLKRYAILIFFWPTLAYWPSSIGKEALILPFLALAAWGAAHLYRRYELRWLLVIGVGLFVVSQVRVHVAAIFAAAIVLGVAFEKWALRPSVAFTRAIVLIVGTLLAIPLAIGVADKFGVTFDSLSTEDLDPVFADIGDTTGQGGSAVSGGVIKTPLDIPAGTIKVLFSPLPYQATNAQMLASSVEGALLLGLIVWQMPKMWRNRSLLRKSPYFLMSFAFMLLFIWAWSAILNLGIIARQRSLVLPFVLAVVAGLGWERIRVASDDHVGEDPSGRLGSGARVTP